MGVEIQVSLLQKFYRWFVKFVYNAGYNTARKIKSNLYGEILLQNDVVSPNDEIVGTNPELQITPEIKVSFCKRTLE